MDGLATRYAMGLLKIANEEAGVSDYKKWLVAIDGIAAANPDLIDFLQSSFIANEVKDAMIDKLGAGMPQYGTNFIKLLVAKKRIIHLHAIRKEFVRLANDVLGIRQGVVFSKDAMSEEQIEAIAKTLADKMHIQVELINEIDTRILGGFRINIQGQSYDYSVNEKLRLLGKQMLERGETHAD